MSVSRAAWGLALLTAACAGTPGAQPHDMGAARHDREAAAHARRAEEIRWSSVRNPTAEDLTAAEAHRRHAADHRAASAALREAEARACSGVAPDDRDTSPFEHASDIVGYRSLRSVGQIPGRGYGPVRTVGVVVTIRAVPGLSVEGLQRVIDCHLARNASLGHVVPELPNCPLVPRGVKARVSSVSGGFAVTIVSNNPSVADEILSRARRLWPAS